VELAEIGSAERTAKTGDFVCVLSTGEEASTKSGESTRAAKSGDSTRGGNSGESAAEKLPDAWRVKKDGCWVNGKDPETKVCRPSRVAAIERRVSAGFLEGILNSVEESLLAKFRT
jgi:hypothetical protein